MRHLIKLALVLNAGVAASFVWLFSYPFGWFIAILAAGSLVGTYIGLAFADIPSAQRRRAGLVAIVACAVEALYGFLYVLSQQSPEWFAAPLSPYASVPLAILHGAAFSVLAFFISLFIVHERGETGPTLAEQRDQLVIETITLLREQVQQARALPAPLPELSDTKAEMIRKLAQMQVDQGITPEKVSTDIIRAATGYDLGYVQQVVSRWRAAQR